MHVRSTKVLIELDEGLLSLIDGEGPVRTKVLRELLSEALSARAQARGEEMPTIEPWEPQDASSDQALRRARLEYLTHDFEAPATSWCSNALHTSTPHSDIGTCKSIPPAGEVIHARVNEGTKAVIRSRPVVLNRFEMPSTEQMAAQRLRSCDDFVLEDAQTPGEQRILDLKK